MKKLDLRLLRMIRHSKGQYISILIVVITGLFMYTLMNSAATNLETSLLEYYEISNFGDVFVDVMQISEKNALELEGLKNVEAVDARIIFDVPVITDNKDEKVNLRLVSVDGKSNSISKLFLEKGKREISSREILLHTQFADARGIEIGDEIELRISGRKYTFEVKGMVSHPEYTYVMENEQTIYPIPDKFGIGFIEEEYLANISGMTDKYNDIVITLEDEEKFSETEKLLEDRLDKFGLRRVVEKKDQLSNRLVHEEINGLKQMSGFIPVVFLAVAAAILAAMISRNVRNDKVIIGILKALGYSRLRILSHYTMYAVSIGIIGGGLGTLLGTIMSGFMTQVYLLYFYIPLLKVAFYPANIITSIVLSVVFCIGAGLVGSRDAMLVTPAEAIRDEPPQTGHRILLERVKPVWERISFTWKIVFRNIFREKKKSVFISLGAAFTIAMSLMTFWISDMMTVVFETHYGEFLSMDYNIDFISPIHEDSLKDLEKILDIDGIEGKMEMPYELQYGRNEKFVSVIGLHKDTSYYNFEDFYGNRIELPDEGMLISSNLAGILEVEPGDNILVKNFIPGMDDEYIEIVDIIDQALGINGYMNIDYMEDKLAGKNLVNGALVDTDKNISEELGDLKNVGGVQSLQDMRDLFFEYLDLAVASISVMVVFSGILGFVIIYSMTVLSINERRLEFSSLRVLGFTKGEIFGIILKENAVMSVVGVIYGIPLGKVLIDAMRTIYVTDLYVFNAPITIKNVIYAIVFTTICLTLAQLITYRKITNLDFIEALKSRTS